jgi:MOSC domain-containing protein YiiM
MMASVVAVCRSDKKGTRKEAVAEGLFKIDHGLVGDAHAAYLPNRHVSLLAIESIDKMRDRGLEQVPGDFAENITTEGIELASLPVGTKIIVGDEVTLEMTQIGKECHTACAIRRQVGDCIMPAEGVFARVIEGGRVRPGDILKIEETV